MNIYKRYFRVTSGPLMDMAIALYGEMDAAHEAISTLCREIGAKGYKAYTDGRIAGFQFDSQPDVGVWKKPNKHRLYWPRKDSGSGKELLKRIASLPELRDLNYSLEMVGLTPHCPVLLGDGRGYTSAAFGAPKRGVVFVRVPWRDTDPAQIEQYVIDKEAGRYFSMELDHLLWKPTPDMVEIKEWEVLREIEEINEAIRRDNSAKQEAA